MHATCQSVPHRWQRSQQTLQGASVNTTSCFVVYQPKTLDITILSRFAGGVLGCCLACLAKNGYQLQPLLKHVQTGLAATFLAQKATSREIDRVQSCRECSPREILPCFVQPPHRCAILEVPLLARLCLCAVRFLTGQFFSALPKLSLPPLLLVFRSSVGQRTFFVNTSARHLP
jgi:hypothetical protein